MSDEDRYRIVMESSVSDFEKELSRMISKGWLPAGGVQITKVYYIQAMYKPVHDVEVSVDTTLHIFAD